MELVHRNIKIDEAVPVQFIFVKSLYKKGSTDNDFCIAFYRHTRISNTFHYHSFPKYI